MNAERLEAAIIWTIGLPCLLVCVLLITPLNYAPLWTHAYARCVDAWPADTLTEAVQHRLACVKYASAQVEAAKAR